MSKNLQGTVSPPEPKQNRLLAGLPTQDYERLLPDLKLVEMPLQWTMSESGDHVNFLHFPISGIVSLMYTLEDGSSSETALVGNEGLVGISIFMGGESMPSSTEVQAYRNAILMFDEIEDVFPSSGGLLSQLFGGSMENNKAPGKAWVNRTLENNPVPAIWITNDPAIDPAYLRRFDISTRFPIPPQKVRLQIARHHLEEFNPPEDWLLKITANEAVSPAQFNRAAKVARHASSTQQISPLTAIEQTLDRSMTLLNQKRQPPRNTISTGYDLRYLNTDSEPHQLPHTLFCHTLSPHSYQCCGDETISCLTPLESLAVSGIPLRDTLAFGGR
jgi:hypothetical protein